MGTDMRQVLTAHSLETDVVREMGTDRRQVLTAHSLKTDVVDYVERVGYSILWGKFISRPPFRIGWRMIKIIDTFVCSFKSV